MDYPICDVSHIIALFTKKLISQHRTPQCGMLTQKKLIKCNSMALAWIYFLRIRDFSWISSSEDDFCD